eukprot:15484969-Alexandrium_andersonii.AAC.1
MLPPTRLPARTLACLLCVVNIGLWSLTPGTASCHHRALDMASEHALHDHKMVGPLCQGLHNTSGFGHSAWAR